VYAVAALAGQRRTHARVASADVIVRTTSSATSPSAEPDCRHLASTRSSPRCCPGSLCSEHGTTPPQVAIPAAVLPSRTGADDRYLRGGAHGATPSWGCSNHRSRTGWHCSRRHRPSSSAAASPARHASAALRAPAGPASAPIDIPLLHARRVIRRIPSIRSRTRPTGKSTRLAPPSDVPRGSIPPRLRLRPTTNSTKLPIRT